MRTRRFNALNDILFKFIFGHRENKDITLSFINAVLGLEGESILYPRMWTHRKKGCGKTLAKHCSDENGFRQCESFFMDRSRCRKFPLRLTEKPISMDSFKNVEFLEHGQSKKVWNPCNRTLV